MSEAAEKQEKQEKQELDKQTPQKASEILGTINLGEEKFASKIISFCSGGPGGGIASLLGSTASILGSTFTKEEEKPKLSLKPEDIDKYKAAFNDFDHNNDGHISTKELMFAFRRA